MAIDHRGLEVPVSEECLDGADVAACGKQVSGEGMTQSMSASCVLLTVNIDGNRVQASHTAWQYHQSTTNAIYTPSLTLPLDRQALSNPRPVPGMIPAKIANGRFQEGVLRSIDKLRANGKTLSNGERGAGFPIFVVREVSPERSHSVFANSEPTVGRRAHHERTSRSFFAVRAGPARFPAWHADFAGRNYLKSGRQARIRKP